MILMFSSTSKKKIKIKHNTESVDRMKSVKCVKKFKYFHWKCDCKEKYINKHEIVYFEIRITVVKMKKNVDNNRRRYMSFKCEKVFMKPCN